MSAKLLLNVLDNEKRDVIEGNDRRQRIMAAEYMKDKIKNIVAFIKDKEAKHDTFHSPSKKSI